jgi:two-component system sensor histidine kinase AgrC
VNDKINFSIRVTAQKFELITVSEVQLSRMVGNLLNNAFDAAKHSESRYVNLDISNVKGYRIKIVVTNSVNAPVDISKIQNKGYSTKEGHTGLGLYQVQSIVDRQQKEGFNVQLEFYNSGENTFIAELLI